MSRRSLCDFARDLLQRSSLAIWPLIPGIYRAGSPGDLCIALSNNALPDDRQGLRCRIPGQEGLIGSLSSRWPRTPDAPNTRGRRPVRAKLVRRRSVFYRQVAGKLMPSGHGAPQIAAWNVHCQATPR
jgi:hypothetical protein